MAPPGYVTLAVLGASAAGLLFAAFLQVAIEMRRVRAQRWLALDRVAWSDRWIDVVFGDAVPPDGPLPPPASDSLLDLRDSLEGEPAEVVDSLVRSYGVDTALVQQLEVHSRSSRFEVLDGLGRARSSRAVPKLIVVAADPEPDTRNAGIRALARSVAAIASPRDRKAAAVEVARVLRTSGSTPAALAEAMELLGQASTDVIELILNDPDSWDDRMVVAALEAAGHHRLEESASKVAGFASSKSRQVRAAALHALSDLEHLPRSAATAVLRAFNDRDPSVRSEAARAARLLDPKRVIPQLEELMTDRDWMVRRIAATTLAELGGPGIRTLIATSLVHGDERARNIATQVLVESRTAAELSQEPEKVG